MDEMIENVENTENKKLKVKKELSEKSKQKLYAKTKKLMDSSRCIQQYELYVYIYKVIIRRLRRLNGYLDSAELLEEYKERLRKLKVEGKEEIYQNMLQLKEQVRRAEDIQWVRKEAARIPGYKDVDEVSAWCEEVLKKMEKQERFYSTIRIIILLAIVLVAALAVKMFLF